MSDVGKIVYKQLKFISKFDLFKYKSSLNPSSEKSRLIEDLYKSLKRFYYFRIIPARIINNTYPFNKNSSSNNNFRKSKTLLIFDFDLYILIKEYIGKEDSNFSNEEKDMLNFSLVRLITSGYYYIGLDKNSFPQNYQGTKEDIELYPKIIHVDKCECIDCTIDEYDYSSAIRKINKYIITDDSELWSDLVYAYGQYKMNDFYNSYNSYKQIEIKANKNDKMEVSFLAKYNMKRLGFIVKTAFMDNRYEYEDLEAIEKDSDKINLDDEIIKVKYFVDEDVYKFLKEIKDGIYIQRLCNEIDEKYIKVAEVIKSIKKGDIISNNVIAELYYASTHLYRFLNDNFLIGNGFSDIYPTLRKSINSFILGYYLGTIKLSEYQSSFFGISHLESFNSQLFKMFLDYAKPQELIRILSENKILNIKFDDHSIKDIFRLVCNFFGSSTDNEDQFKIIRPDEIFISYMNYNRNFNSLINSKFNIFCVILAYFEFSEQQLNVIYEKLNNFLRFVDLDRRDNTSYVNYILDNKYKILNYALIEETLKTFSDKKLYNGTYIKLLEILNKKNKRFVNSNFNITEFNFDEHWFDFDIVYKSLTVEQKKVFKNKLKEHLNSNVYTSSYYIAINDNMLRDKKTIAAYHDTIRSLIQSKSSDSRRDNNNFYVRQFFDLVNRGIIKNYNFEDIVIYQNHYNFIVSPETYKESEFDINWLKIFDWESFLKRFSKIDYIFQKLENYLNINYDEDLSKIYFKIKKYRNLN